MMIFNSSWELIYEDSRDLNYTDETFPMETGTYYFLFYSASIIEDSGGTIKVITSY
jgi:hypothetical protein